MPRRGALAGSVLDEFAQLYEVALGVSSALTPPVVDDMEIWEVAVCLGKALPDDDVVDDAPRATSVDEVAAKRYAAIARRRAGLPELPEVEERPAPLDTALATLITTNAPERLR